MILENFENMLTLLAAVLGLLGCLFKYIKSPKRGYLPAGNNLLCKKQRKWRYSSSFFNNCTALPYCRVRNVDCIMFFMGKSVS